MPEAHRPKPWCCVKKPCCRVPRPVPPALTPGLPGHGAHLSETRYRLKQTLFLVCFWPDQSLCLFNRTARGWWQGRTCLLVEVLVHIDVDDDSRSGLSHRRRFAELQWKWREPGIPYLLFFFLFPAQFQPQEAHPRSLRDVAVDSILQFKGGLGRRFPPPPPLLSCCVGLIRTHSAEAEKHFFTSSLPAAAFFHLPPTRPTALNLFSGAGYVPPTNHH